MFRIISPPTEPVPTYVCDTEEDLEQILKEQYDGNVIGITAFNLENKCVYMLGGDHTWSKF